MSVRTEGKAVIVGASLSDLALSGFCERVNWGQFFYPGRSLIEAGAGQLRGADWILS